MMCMRLVLSIYIRLGLKAAGGHTDMLYVIHVKQE